MPYANPHDPVNRAKVNARRRIWRKENPEAARRKARRDDRTLSGRFQTLKSMAKVRGLIVSLSRYEYDNIASLPCYYCEGQLPETGHGIDRISSDIGYVQGNVRPCCSKCNKAKSDTTEAEFKEWSLRLFNHWSVR